MTSACPETGRMSFQSEPGGTFTPSAVSLDPALAGKRLGAAGYAFVRCLHGARPEHRARGLVADLLTGAQPRHVLGDVQLAVSEMVSNARQHAPGPYELRVLFGPRTVRVAVVDGGSDHAVLAGKLRRAAVGVPGAGESGRGLQIITGLFPGGCGAGPAITCSGRAPAKQVWIETARAGGGVPGRPPAGRGPGRREDAGGDA
jgi:Histidine kinase-like ATPase domain